MAFGNWINRVFTGSEFYPPERITNFEIKLFSELSYVIYFQVDENIYIAYKIGANNINYLKENLLTCYILDSSIAPVKLENYYIYFCNTYEDFYFENKNIWDFASYDSILDTDYYASVIFNFFKGENFIAGGLVNGIFSNATITDSANKILTHLETQYIQPLNIELKTYGSFYFKVDSLNKIPNYRTHFVNNNFEISEIKTIFTQYINEIMKNAY